MVVDYYSREINYYLLKKSGSKNRLTAIADSKLFCKTKEPPPKRRLITERYSQIVINTTVFYPCQ